MTVCKSRPGGHEGRKEIEMMSYDEMKEYLLAELKEEHKHTEKSGFFFLVRIFVRKIAP